MQRLGVWVVVAVGVGVGALLVLDRVSRAEDRDGPHLSLELRPDPDAGRGAGGYGVSVVLSNVGDAPAQVSTRLLVGPEGTDADLGFRLMGPSRRLQPTFGRELAAEGPGAWRVLEPGDSVMRRLDLARWFDLSEPGFYDVQAIYENRRDPPAGKAWKGRVTSRLLRFTRKED